MKLLPPYAPSPKDSSHKMLLKAERFLFAVGLGANFLVNLVAIPEEYFLYLSNWGMFFAFLFFLIASLGYCFPVLDGFAYILFEISWPLEWLITLAYWTAVFPLDYKINLLVSLMLHGLPLILLVIDCCLSRIVILRSHWGYPFAASFVYAFCVNLPVTLSYQRLYPLISYQNAWTYIMLLVGALVEILAMEVHYRFKHMYLLIEQEALLEI